ncbi:MAG: saccharopine dehydrogenase, partial [Pikeienuella sp.]
LPLDGPLSHRHIHFGHVFKDQTGWREDLARFRDGGGTLYDLEFLVDESGRRVAAFGYWAGYAGAALGLLLWAGLARGDTPPLAKIEPVSGQAELLDRVRTALNGQTPTALVTGALGRCGTGATDMLTAVGITPTRWDIAETAHGGPFPEIIAHDLFVNCVLAAPGIPVFVPQDALPTLARRLTAVADVSCDPSSDYNPVPIYDRTTTFDDPAIVVATEGMPIAVTAIDHLPSLLPIESTEDYSAQLTPSLLTLNQLDQGVWARAKAEFDKHIARL